MSPGVCGGRGREFTYRWQGPSVHSRPPHHVTPHASHTPDMTSPFVAGFLRNIFPITWKWDVDMRAHS